MKNKLSKRILSIMLAMVMLIGLLPTAAIPVFAEETTYTKAGEVGAVTAECEAFTEPELGAEIKGDFNFTVTSPTDQRVSITSGYSAYWEKLSYGFWEKYTEAAFNEGTYRLQLTMNSFALSDGSYYALLSSTTLTLNDVSFTAGKLYDHYDSQGRGSLIFYSPEYTVAKEAGTYLVTVTASSNGLASADKAYGKTGEVVTLTAQPYDGYRLKEWRVLSGGVTVENNRFTIGSEDVEIKAIFESSNENLGNITQVEVTTKEDVDYRPVMGRSPERIFVTIESSTPNDHTLGVGGYGYGRWQVKQPDGSWEYFMDEPFTYGTYRMCISLENEVIDGTYHAITKDTVLIVDGDAWTADPYSYVNYYGEPNGRGEISFNSPEMDVIPVANVSDSTSAGCYVVPMQGEFTVPLGDTFSFIVESKDYYELTDPDALEVYVNGEPVTPSENGGYYVSNVTEDLDIYCDGSGFTSYSNLTITAGGKTVKEKIFDGGTYTFKTLAEFGVAVPENSTFTGWKIGGKTYQPGETYTVPGGTEIAVNAAFTGLYNITVEGGKAYADEAHTIPISAAAENQVIYVVADPAPEGKVFSYWSRTFAVVGGHGWFGDSEAAVTTFTVYDSDVALTPVYETLVDEIVIGGMTKPSADVAIDNSDYSYKWGCSVPADAGYTLGISYWYDITDGEPELAMSDGDVFQIGHTYRFKARIHLKADHIYPANPEDIAVSLEGFTIDEYEWTINEIGYTSATIYFEFACEREKPDYYYERPEGSGTSGDPFKISKVTELYWFAAFANGIVAYPDGITVERNEACARLVNNITVNPTLLNADGTLIGASGFERWTPIGYYSEYNGTFDGQGYTVSGLYFDHAVGYINQSNIGFIGKLGDGGCVRNLSVFDSWFATPSSNRNYYLGGIVGYVADATVSGCAFSGVIKVNTEYCFNAIGGIAGYNLGVIDDCYVMGWIKAYSAYGAGGIAGRASGALINCVNHASVINTLPDESDGGTSSATGGIVGLLVSATVKNSSNNGTIGGKDFVGGIVGRAQGSPIGRAVINRCYNTANVGGSGIVGWLGESDLITADSNGYVTVKNCYNKGSVVYGIAEYASGAGNVIEYCHNVGTSATPILGGATAGSDLKLERCYYKANSEADSYSGTEYKTADEFSGGSVLTLLDNGNWAQGANYPVLAEINTVSVSGTITSFGGETDNISIELFADGSGSAEYIVTVMGNTAAYSINGVAEGTYTMKVSKNNHAIGEYTVVVDNDNLVKDVTIWQIGDITGDGNVDVRDLVRLKRIMSGLMDASAAPADINNNGNMDSEDLAILKKYILGITV